MKKEVQITARESMDNSLLADIIYVFTTWENNWQSRDFKEAFSASSVGWEWLWEKFEISKRQAFTFYLCLDHKHQQMLVKYLYEEKYIGEIDSYKQMRAIFEKLTGEGD